jgi:hypothetical protein
MMPLMEISKDEQERARFRSRRMAETDNGPFLCTLWGIPFHQFSHTRECGEGTKPINRIKPINMEGTPLLRGQPYPTL